MKYILTLLFIVALTVPSLACDVNLFAVIAGNTKQDAFNEAIGKLAMAVKGLGTYYLDENKAQRYLLSFMETWLEFSSSFSQFPPEWAKKDPNWNLKFTELGRIIGKIRKLLPSDKPASHDAMLKFSRRLAWLCEYVPMTERAKLLLEITQCFDKIWDIFFEGNNDAFKVHVAELVAMYHRLNSMLDDNEKKLSKYLPITVDRLRVLALQANPLNSQAARITIADAESEFVALNENLSAALKTAKNKNENSASN